MTPMAVATPGVLFRRFAPAVIAVYLMHWGVWELLFVAEQLVMAALTRTINWVALTMFHSFSSVWEEVVSGKYLLQQVAIGVVPIILGLLVGWWVLRRRRKPQQHPLQPA